MLNVTTINHNNGHNSHNDVATTAVRSRQPLSVQVTPNFAQSNQPSQIQSHASPAQSNFNASAQLPVKSSQSNIEKMEQDQWCEWIRQLEDEVQGLGLGLGRCPPFNATHHNYPLPPYTHPSAPLPSHPPPLSHVFTLMSDLYLMIGSQGLSIGSTREGVFDVCLDMMSFNTTQSPPSQMSQSNQDYRRPRSFNSSGKSAVVTLPPPTLSSGDCVSHGGNP